MNPERVWLGWALRRGASSLLVLALVTVTTFAALAVLPGDPLASVIDPSDRAGITPEQEAALRARYGLDAPLPVRYLRWCGALLRGDLGHSIRTGRPVTGEIARRIGPTLELNLAALALVLSLGVPLGWWLARRAGSRADKAATLGLLALYAVPAFWLALILQSWIAVRLGLLPLYGRTPPGGDTGLGVRLAHLALPAACLALQQLAFFARFSRDTTLEGLRSPRTLFARACGLREGRILWAQGIRPALVPLVTLLGLLLPSLATGSVLVESIFSWPGLGRLLYQAVLGRDFPVVLGMTTIIAALTILGNLAADLAAAWLDPRSRVSGETSHA